LPHPVDTPTSE